MGDVKQRDNFSNRITLFGFILSILVIYIHTNNSVWYGLDTWGKTFSANVTRFEWFISDDIAKAAVPGFFVMSGYLFYKRFDMSMYSAKMRSRFFSLFIPYLCWNLLRLIYAVLINNIIFTSAGTEAHYIELNLENILGGIFMYQYNLGYWYMFQLILYTLLCPLVYLLIKNKWTGLLAVLAIFAVNMLPDLPKKIPLLLFDSFFFYMVGAYVGRHFKDAVKAVPKKPYLVSAFLFVASQGCMYLFRRTYMMHWYLIFALLLISSFFLLTAKAKSGEYPWWMKISFFIYSLHGTVLEVSHRIVYHFLPHTPLCALIEFILLPFAVLLMVIFAAFVLRRFVPPLWSILNGGRQKRRKSTKTNVAINVGEQL